MCDVERCGGLFYLMKRIATVNVYGLRCTVDGKIIVIYRK